MPVEIRVPQLGESIVEATIAQWLKQEGDAVTAGEPLVELETDKVNVQVPADGDGVLSQITRKEGETVNVGEAIGILAEPGTAATPSPPSSETAPAASVSAPASQEAFQPRREPGRNGEEAEEAPRHEVLVSPVARKLAEENNVDLHMVKGSGAGGRITKEDVANFLERTSHAPATAHTIAQGTARPAAAEGPGQIPSTAGTPTPPPVQLTPPAWEPAETGPPPGSTPVSPAAPSPAPTAVPAQGDRREERVRMSRRRQTIAARLVEAQQTAAMLTTFNEIDMSAVMEVRKRRRDAFKERHGIGLGFMSFFTKASIGALKAFPHLNAEIQENEIVVKHYYDMGIAVSTEEGLVVPVVRDADRKTFAEIERNIVDLATRARDGKLTLPELQGGTFTITNGGVFGSMLSTPILNAPQVGILGLHKIEERPIALNGEVVIRPMMYVALSYDHRIVDGSEAVRFLVRVKELIEDPESLLLEG